MNGFDIPKAPNAGDRISARFFQGIIDALQRLKPKAGDGVRLEYGRDGVTIHAKPSKGGSDFDWGAFPFRVIDASTTDPDTGVVSAKVRVLPGVCNFSIPKVSGASNEYWTEQSHFLSAPRIDCTDISLAGGFWVALEFAAPDAGSVYPSEVNTVAVVNLEWQHLPLARVVANQNDANEVVIEGIRQMVFDSIGAVSVGRDAFNNAIWATTR